jgi:hypothetical protein
MLRDDSTRLRVTGGVPPPRARPLQLPNSCLRPEPLPIRSVARRMAPPSPASRVLWWPQKEAAAQSLGLEWLSMTTCLLNKRQQRVSPGAGQNGGGCLQRQDIAREDDSVVPSRRIRGLLRGNNLNLTKFVLRGLTSSLRLYSVCSQSPVKRHLSHCANVKSWSGARNEVRACLAG